MTGDTRVLPMAHLFQDCQLFQLFRANISDAHSLLVASQHAHLCCWQGRGEEVTIPRVPEKSALKGALRHTSSTSRGSTSYPNCKEPNRVCFPTALENASQTKFGSTQTKVSLARRKVHFLKVPLKELNSVKFKSLT